MRISSVDEGLGCQSVYRVLGVLNADLNYQISNSEIEQESFKFESVLAGSAALAVHADRRGFLYETETRDVDLYTDSQMTNLESLEELLHIKKSQDGTQYCYDTTNASSTARPAEVPVDIITDFHSAFEWDSTEAEEVEKLLEEQTESSKPIQEGTATIYLPDLEALDRTFEYSERDYSDRRELIEKMQEKPV